MLAIVIPYYKLNFFEHTLQSLASQTDKRFKVYIGDDASPENPNDLLEKYKGKFDFVYHRFEFNLGGTSLAKQWERCIALSGNEEWIMILGDDDVLGESVVEEFYNQYDEFKNKSNLVRFATEVVNEEKRGISRCFLHPKFESAGNAFYRKFIGKTRSSISEYIFRKESYLKFKFHNYPLAWCSDDMAWLDFSVEKLIYSINDANIKIGFSSVSLSGMTNNLDLKHQASIQFYKELVQCKLHLFSKKQSLNLLMEYEVLIKQTRKLNRLEWECLFLGYLKKFSLIAFIKFNRRALISLYLK